MCRFGDFSTSDLLKCVDALAGGIEGVHEMHFGSSFVKVRRSWCCRGIAGNCDCGGELEIFGTAHFG